MCGKGLSVRFYEIYPFRVPSAVERGAEKNLYDTPSKLVANNARAEADNIGVVMTPCHFGRICIVAERRADTANFVGRKRHANARSAYENGFFIFACNNSASRLLRKIRIVNRSVGKGPYVFKRSAFLLKA